MNNLMQQASRMNLGARRNTNFVEVLVIDGKEFVVSRQSVLPLSLKRVVQVDHLILCQDQGHPPAAKGIGHLLAHSEQAEKDAFIPDIAKGLKVRLPLA